MGREKSVGFEYLLQLYKETQKTINTLYKGISLRKQDNNSFYLRFKTNSDVRRDWPTGLKLNQEGLLKIVNYAKLVHEKLRNYESESDFENWYNETIRGINNRKVNDIQNNEIEITFKQAIDNLYDWFMAQTDRRGYKRKDNLVSSKNSFNTTYTRYFQSLPLDKKVNLDDCLTIVNSYYPEHPKSYRKSITTIRKLLEINELYSLKDQWDKQRFHKTNNRNKNERKKKKQIITEEQIIELYNAVISNIKTLDRRGSKENKQWLNAIMIGFIYGLVTNRNLCYKKP